MKIVFDAYWWGGGPPSLRRVCREIILAWARCYPEDDLVLVTRKRHAVRGSRDRPRSALVHTTRLWPQGLAARYAVARVAREHRADAVVTHNFAAEVAEASSCVYLHDVLFVTDPQWFTPVERLYFSLMTRWVTSADVVFTSSASEAERIRSHTRARRVQAVGLGLSTELVTADAVDPDPSLSAGRFLLTVGRLNVRKNLERTVLAALDTGIVDRDFPLVVAGSPDGRRAANNERVAQAIREGAVVFTGFVSEARLRWLYRSTRLFLCLSLGEGYGMPPVEAAAFGAPVLASDLPVFRENLGALARYADPSDTEAITSALIDCLGSSDASGGRAPGAIAQLVARHDWEEIVTTMRESAAARRPVSA